MHGDATLDRTTGDQSGGAGGREKATPVLDVRWGYAASDETAKGLLFEE